MHHGVTLHAARATPAVPPSASVGSAVSREKFRFAPDLGVFSECREYATAWAQERRFWYQVVWNGRAATFARTRPIFERHIEELGELFGRDRFLDETSLDVENSRLAGSLALAVRRYYGERILNDRSGRMSRSSIDFAQHSD